MRVDLLNHLDINREIKKYIASPFANSTGDVFTYRFELADDYATLFITNQSRGGDTLDIYGDKARKLHSINNATKWEFFVTYNVERSVLTVSEYVLSGKRPIFSYTPQIYVPIMELVIDMVGDGCCFFFLQRPEESLSYNVFHVSFIEVANSCHVRGNFNLQLVDVMATQ
jgi:hypothetical protein